MKICAIICEYNPFHNGHLYQLRQAKALSGADAVICLMSGNFLQRGEPAVLNKYTRAKHAVLAGADAVLELPAVFSCSNAELFAKGAVHILSSLPEVTTLCFGAEKADKPAFLLGARYLNTEPEEVSKRLREALNQGVSYAKARANAFAGFIPLDLLSSPNNILGLEYTKAILSQNANIDILPIQRLGHGYSDESIDGEFASAKAIRLSIINGSSVKHTVPAFVERDLPKKIEYSTLDALEKYAVLSSSNEDLAKVCDCTEGLENAFKKSAKDIKPFTETLTSPRYTASRIRRIALQNLLRIQESLIRGCLSAPLYIKPLAIKAENTELLSVFGKANYPLIVRAHDENVLEGYAKQCFDTERFADDVYSILNPNTKKQSIFI